MKKYFIILSFFLLAQVACNDDAANEHFMDSDKVSILSYLQQNPKYTEWYNIMERSGLAPSFSYGTTLLTFFAIENEAVRAYMGTKDWDSVEDISVEEAKLLMKFHTVIDASYQLEELRDGKLAETTASGDILSCMLVYGDEIDENNGVFMSGYAKIISFDILTVNGVVHELDQVMEPIKNTLYDFLVLNESKFSILKDAYDQTGLDSLLTKMDRDDIDMKCRRTFFVTSDSIFKEHNILSVDQLKEYLCSGGSEVEKLEALKLYLQYRIIDRDFTTGEFSTRLNPDPTFIRISNTNISTVDKTKGVTLPTMAKNKLIQVREDGLNYNFNEGTFFLGKNYNLQQKNGFIHEVDNLFEIHEPESILTTIETTDYVYFEQYPVYRKKVDINNITMERKDFASAISWISTPMNKEGSLSYLIRSIGGYGMQNSALYGDRLELDLGPVGELTLKTPPIAKGRYKIHAILGTRVGACQAFLDTEKIGEVLSEGGAGYIQLGYVTFDETKEHEITMKVVSSGLFGWDAIIFSPM